MNKRAWQVLGAIGLIVLLFIFIKGCDKDFTSTVTVFSPEQVPEPEIRYGLVWDSLSVDSGIIKPGQTLSHLLDPYGIGPGKIVTLAANSRPVFNVLNMKVDNKWLCAAAKDSASTPLYFIYENSNLDYIVFSLCDTLRATRGNYPVDTIYKRTSGVIESSLWLDLDKINAPTELALALADVYAWTIDFTHVQEGDEFDVYYSRKRVNGKEVGMPVVLFSSFTHHNTPMLAYRFDQGDGPDFFDPQGASLRKAFLKSPIEFGRMSSGYNKKRFHPVLKRVKAHLGTDYAAPKGTPIRAVGDGVVIKSEYKGGNGNYVKIRHNGTYETQYLHMSRRKVSVGDHVTQGQTIGLVGSTGLATGPHVCFRFWKYGVQVDHRREIFPPSTPVSENAMKDFAIEVKRLVAEADSLLN